MPTGLGVSTLYRFLPCTSSQTNYGHRFSSTHAELVLSLERLVSVPKSCPGRLSPKGLHVPDREDRPPLDRPLCKKYHGTQHPRAFGKSEVRDDLSYLATERTVAASTQNQALNALLFLHRDVLGADWDEASNFERAREPERLPVVLTQAEVKSVLGHMKGPNGLVAHLLYGAGLRLSEALRLRVKDLDFEYEQITVRQGKGKKDRRTLLPGMLEDALRR